MGQPELDSWVDEHIMRLRVSSTPGGVALDATEAREFLDDLREQVEHLESLEDDSDD